MKKLPKEAQWNIFNGAYRITTITARGKKDAMKQAKLWDNLEFLHVEKIKLNKN